MRTLDRSFLSPTREQLAEALQAGVEFANRRVRNQFLPWPLADLEETLANYADRAEGVCRWSDCQMALAESGQRWPEVGCAWWSDRLGRKHVRIEATSRRFENAAGEVFDRFWKATPLAYLAPRAVAQVQRGENRQFIAFCRCGVYGPPEAIGWMGDCCGPCHDRREEGTELPSASGWTLPAEGELTELLFPPRGGLLVAGLDRVRLWDLDGREVLWENSCPLLAPGPRATCSPDGRWLAFATRERTVRVWDVATGRRYSEVEQPGILSTERLAGLTFLRDGRHLALLSPRRLTVWAMNPGGLQLEGDWETGAGEARSLAIAPDGRGLLVGTQEGVLRQWDLSGGLVLEWSVAQPFALTFLASLDNTLLRADGQQGSIRLYDLPTRTERASLQGTWQLTLTPDRRIFVACGDEEHGGLVFRDTISGDTLARLRVPRPDHFLEFYRGVAISPDGRLLAIGRGTGSIHFYPLELLGLG